MNPLAPVTRTSAARVNGNPGVPRPPEASGGCLAVSLSACTARQRSPQELGARRGSLTYQQQAMALEQCHGGGKVDHVVSGTVLSLQGVRFAFPDSPKLGQHRPDDVIGAAAHAMMDLLFGHQHLVQFLARP